VCCAVWDKSLLCSKYLLCGMNACCSCWRQVLCRQQLLAAAAAEVAPTCHQVSSPVIGLIVMLPYMLFLVEPP
jgi:hypothetical protein